jgi:hypothetical protein
VLDFSYTNNQEEWSMKFNDEHTGLIGLAIGAAVIGLVSERKAINRDNIIQEIERQGRSRGDGVEDEVFLQAAELVRKGV